MEVVRDGGSGKLTTNRKLNTISRETNIVQMENERIKFGFKDLGEELKTKLGGQGHWDILKQHLRLNSYFQDIQNIKEIFEDYGGVAQPISQVKDEILGKKLIKMVQKACGVIPNNKQREESIQKLLDKLF